MNKGLLVEIQEIVDSLAATNDEKKLALVDVLLMLIKKITKSSSVFTDIPGSFSNEIRPAMLAQMAAAERRTEKAADNFMTIAEQLSSIVNDIPEAKRPALQAKINAMFEACAFQDLVAQHLNEIKLLIDDLTYDVETLHIAVEELTNSSSASADMARTVKEKRVKNSLLNGPSTDF